jgi:hypothetical protein
MKKPAEIYSRSPVTFDPDRPVEPTYPEQFHVRTVRSTGTVKIQNSTIFVSAALAGYDVGLEFVARGCYALWFAHRRLGELDVGSRRFVADAWNTVTPEEETLSPEVA